MFSKNISVGGLKIGHSGHGRKRVSEAEADEVINLPAPIVCPVHGNKLTEWTSRTKTVVHSVPAKTITRVYTIQRVWCAQCRKYHENKIPGIMPHFAFSNDLLAQALVDHYKHGIPMGTEARRLGVKKSALINASKKVAQLLESGVNTLRDDFRKAKNNLAERRLRPLVTARKVCFGSQSEKGLEVREILMSIIDTLSLRFNDPVAKLSSVLDEIGRNKNADVDALLWGNAN